MLPIICIAIVLHLGHAAREVRALTRICLGLRQWLVATWAKFHHIVISVRKDWKHVLVQKVVTLNTCCDIACPTFQLPHITTGFFSEPQMPTNNRLFSDPPTFEETQQTFSQMKKLAFHSQCGDIFRWSGQVSYSLFSSEIT